MIRKYSQYLACLLVAWAVFNNVNKAVGLSLIGYEFELAAIACFLFFMPAYYLCRSCVDGHLFKAILGIYIACACLLLGFGGRDLSFIDSLKGWYGVVAPLGVLFCILLGGNSVSRFVKNTVYLSLFAISIGIILDSVLGLQFGKYLSPNDDSMVKFADNSYRASFIFDSPMAAGYLMAFTSFFSLILASCVSGRRFYALALYTLSVVSALSCFLTFSRGGLMVLFLSLFLYYLRRINLGTTIQAVAIIVAFCLIASASPSARDWALTIVDFKTEASNESRKESWISSYNLISESDVFGHGIGSLRNPQLRKDISISTGAESTILYAGVEGGVFWATVTGALYFYLFFRFAIFWFLSGKLFVQSLLLQRIHLALICFCIASISYSFAFPMFVEKLTPLIMFLSFGLALRLQRDPFRVDNSDAVGLQMVSTS